MNHPGERTVVVEGQPPAAGRTPPSLSRALRIVDGGPRYVYRAALVSLAGTCVLAIALAFAVHPARGLRRPQQEIIAAGLAGLVLVAVLVIGAVAWPAARRAAVLDRLAAPGQRAAIWLALTAWFPLLLVAVYYRVKATVPTSVAWISFGYLDKRWVTATYLLVALAPMLLLVTAARVLLAGRGHPDSWRAWLRALAPARRATEQADASTALERDGVPAAAPAGWWGARYVGVVAGVLTAVGTAYYFYGPPWFLAKAASTGSNGIGFQEDVFLSGFQAISKGAVPYIGPASVQYGPGAQLLSYLYMRHISGFSVAGFRESWAMFQWIGATIFFIVLFLALGYGRGLAAALMSALIYPALQLLGFAPAGHAYGGFFGWANPLRYAGAIALILLLPAAIRRSPSWRGLTAAAVLGLLWGGLSYVAQENLVAGAVGVIVVAVLLVLSGTVAWRSVWPALLAVLGGFVISWLPAIAYYAAKGLLVRFVYLYFLITRAVAQGYSNTPFGGLRPHRNQIANNAPWQPMFYVLPFVLAILALLVVIQFRPFRIAMEWSRQRIILTAVVVTSILLYQGALLRSDADHLTGTLLAVPALVITVATVLPRALGGRRRAVLVLAGAAVVVASFALLPPKFYQISRIHAVAVAPYRDRQRLAALPAPARSTLAARRVGGGLTSAAMCCQHDGEPLSQFVALMDRVHAIVGNRTAYVASFRGGYPGLIYFVADLTPAPVPLDLHTMVFTAQQRSAYLATFRRRVLPHTQALLTTSLTVSVARSFRHQYPHARTITLTFAGRPYYVLLAN